MNKRPEIPPTIKAHIDKLLSSSAEAFQDNDITYALSLAHQAWDAIPDPKESWDYYPQSLAVGFVEDYTDLGDLEKVREWTAITYKTYDDPNRENHYTLMLEGRALEELGEKVDAVKVFERVHDLFGVEGFKGADVKYLELIQR